MGDITVIIFGAVGVILTAVFVWICSKLVKRLKQEEKTQLPSSSQARQPSTTEPQSASDQNTGEVLAHLDSTGQVVSELSVSKPKPTPVEEDVQLKEALKKTEENLFGRIRSLFKSGDQNQHLEDIEEILYTSDLGPQTVQRLMSALEENLSKKEKADIEIVRSTLKKEMMDIFDGATQGTAQIRESADKPTVLMIVGVNGAGKTTSIGKISAQFASQGKKVLVAAGDTFRAAAGGQLKVWTDRAQVEIFSPEGVTDPSAVAFDAVAKAKAQGYDIVIIDTAGRLHTQANLMEELKKMKRVMTKVIPDAPHEVLIVLDANSGQNALIQAREFHAALGLSGVILTKMDGTAKGGVAVGVAQELKVPIKLIGVGERIQDLRRFSHQEFVDSIFQ